MKLDLEAFRHLSHDEFRVLTAVEMGMKNHDIVPTVLIASIAALKHGGVNRCLRELLKNKLIAHDAKRYDGYHLTYSGYDYLALKALVKRGKIAGFGQQIGVGKESDIFLAYDSEGGEVAVKLHRLGRTSFRAVKHKRDYLAGRHSASWYYLSRLAALKEYAFMKALHEHGFPTPTPIDVNRHCVVMSLVHGHQLAQYRELPHPAAVYGEMMELAVRFAQHGLVHCDLNEFNVLFDENARRLVVIDFPQMVSTNHPNAEELFNRDVRCIRNFFERHFGIVGAAIPVFATDGQRLSSLDAEVAASGFSQAHDDVLLGEYDGRAPECDQPAQAPGSDDGDSDDDGGTESDGEVDNGDRGANGAADALPPLPGDDDAERELAAADGGGADSADRGAGAEAGEEVGDEEEEAEEEEAAASTGEREEAVGCGKTAAGEAAGRDETKLSEENDGEEAASAEEDARERRRRLKQLPPKSKPAPAATATSTSSTLPPPAPAPASEAAPEGTEDAAAAAIDERTRDYVQERVRRTVGRPRGRRMVGTRNTSKLAKADARRRAECRDAMWG